MNRPLLSLVIPFYKNAHTIDRALSSLARSLANVDHTAVEVIFVNNNSTDGSLERVAEFLESTSHATIISEPKQGVSQARNTGIAKASGTYIAFLDADDELASEYFECIIDAAKRAPDLIMIGMQGSTESKPVLTHDIRELERHHLSGWWNWQFVFKRSLAKGSEFRGGCFEDYGYFPAILSAARNFFITGKNLYHYNYNEASLTRSNIKWRISELQAQFRNIQATRHLIHPCIYERARFDFYDQVSLLRSIAGTFPALSPRDIFIYLTICFRRGLLGQGTSRLVYRHASPLYRLLKC